MLGRIKNIVCPECQNNIHMQSLNALNLKNVKCNVCSADLELVFKREFYYFVFIECLLLGYLLIKNNYRGSSFIVLLLWGLTHNYFLMWFFLEARKIKNM